MARIDLYLEQYASCVTLMRVKYLSDSRSLPLVSCRAGLPVAHTSSESIFQWSSAVKALTLLLLRTAATRGETAELIGRSASPAASLDYAITKEPNWLVDMYGIDERGKPNVKSLIRRSNSERKQPGPVRLWVDQTRLPAKNINFFVNNAKLQDCALLLEISELIEQDWYSASKSSKRRSSSESDDTQSLPDGRNSSVGINYQVNPEQGTATVITRTHLSNSTKYPIFSRSLGLDLNQIQIVEGPCVRSQSQKEISLVSSSSVKCAKRYSVEFNPPVLPGQSADYEHQFTFSGDVNKDALLTYRVRIPTDHLSIEISLGSKWQFDNLSVLKESAGVLSVEGLKAAKIIRDEKGVESIQWVITNPELGAEYRIYWYAVEIVASAHNLPENLNAQRLQQSF